MDSQTLKKIKEAMGMDTPHGRLKKELESASLTMALIAMLRREAFLSDEDVQQIHALSDQIAENLATFQIASIRMAEAQDGNFEGLGVIELAQCMKDLACSGRWLMQHPGILDPRNVEEIIYALEQTEKALQALEEKK